MNMKFIVLTISFCFSTLAPLQARSSATDDAHVYIINPVDEVAQSPILVKFDLRGMNVAPADVEREPTLQLLFADFVHISHDPVIQSKPITIQVVE